MPASCRRSPCRPSARPIRATRRSTIWTQGRVVICAAGTGLPFFTTDTGAALRAAEMGCDALLQGHQRRWRLFRRSQDSIPTPSAIDRLTFTDILARDLRIMDPAAIALARDNGIPVVVFSIRTPGAVLEVVTGKGRSTIVTKRLTPWHNPPPLMPRNSSGACTAPSRRSSTISAACAPAAPRSACSNPSMSMPMARRCRSTRSPPSPCPSRGCFRSRFGTGGSSSRSKRRSAPPILASIRRPRARSSACRMPDLTQERRKELVKVAHQYAEKARIAVRNVRRDGMEHLKQLEKEHLISEDEHRDKAGEVQKMTDETIREIDAALKSKGRRDHAGLSRRLSASSRARSKGMSNREPLQRCHGMSPSSWTAMAAGRARADCRAPPATARASRRCAGRSARPAISASHYLTIFSFSAENWSRPKTEVSFLFDLMRRFVRQDVAELHRAGRPHHASSASARDLSPTSSRSSSTPRR